MNTGKPVPVTGYKTACLRLVSAYRIDLAPLVGGVGAAAFF
jgi:hypothetical protein